MLTRVNWNTKTEIMMGACITQSKFQLLTFIDP